MEVSGILPHNVELGAHRRDPSDLDVRELLCEMAANILHEIFELAQQPHQRDLLCHSGSTASMRYSAADDPQLAEFHLSSALVRHRRISWLIVALMALSAAPLLELLIPEGASWELAYVAIGSASAGTLLVLSFWVGLGRQSLIKRLVGGLLGTVYVSVWAQLVMEIEYSSLPIDVSVPWEEYATRVLFNLGLVASVTAMFLALRPWWKLERTPPGDEVAGLTQFSLGSILLVTAAAALVMGSVRAARQLTNVMEDATAPLMAIIAAIIAVTALAVTFAALLPGATTRLRLAALGASLLLGIAISLAAGNDESGGAFLVTGSLIGTVLATILMLSLLVVRSVGYRLVRKVSDDSMQGPREVDEATVPVV